MSIVIRRSRREPALLIALIAVLALAGMVVPQRAGAAPDLPVSLHPVEGQTRLPRTCEELQPLLRQVQLADTSIVSSLRDPAGPTLRACVFQDNRTSRPDAWLMAVTTLEQFRTAKADVQGELADTGVDTCTVVFWAAISNSVQEALNFDDAHNAGKPCDPVVEAHGPKSDSQLDAVRDALTDAMHTGEDRMGWSLTWPLQVDVWDDDAGIRGLSRSDLSEDVSAEGEAGVAIVGTHSMTRVLLDLSQADSTDDLRAIIAHEYGHIVQHGITGCACTMPFFAIEGGAEFFASLVVGPEEDALAERFQEARDDVYTGHAQPLRDLIDRNISDPYAPYSRGYAAMRFLTDRWGADAFAGLYRDNRDGSPDRYLTNLGKLTGMRLDDFDAALTGWLKTQRGFATPPGPNTTLAPDGILLRLFTGRTGASGFEERDTFDAADRAVELRAVWDCHEGDIDGEASLFDPSGRAAGRFGGPIDAGCVSSIAVRIGLDEKLNGGTLRSRPGVWRVELSAAGKPQGAVTFTILP